MTCAMNSWVHVSINFVSYIYNNYDATVMSGFIIMCYKLIKPISDLKGGREYKDC